MKKLIRDKYEGEFEGQEKIDVKSQEYFEYLLKKLEEEISELKDTEFQDVYEYADVIEVILGIGKFHGHEMSKILQKTLEKRMKKGSFDKGLLWESKNQD